MFKVSLKSSTWDHIWSYKEGVSGTNLFYWVQNPCCCLLLRRKEFCLNHNVSIYINWSPYLVMTHVAQKITYMHKIFPHLIQWILKKNSKWETSNKVFVQRCRCSCRTIEIVNQRDLNWTIFKNKSSPETTP